MDILDADDDANELDVALLIEFGNLSTEERRVLDQPIQENPQEEEEVIVQELEQALQTNEEEVFEEDFVEEAAQAPIEENTVISSFEEQDQYASYANPLLFPNTIVGSVHENVNNPLHYSRNLFEIFQRAEIEILEEEKNEAIKEFVDSIARKFQAKENAKVNAERDQPRITQGESSRRSDGVSTGTRHRRAPSNDDNPRPNKRGGGRSGGDHGGRSSGGGRGRKSGSDQRGRASGGDRGGRSSGSGRSGRSFPPFLNILTGQDMSPTDP
ncbi:keratin, type II cytoskeletal 1-like [Impatiens glandulifera]|uniref:keratin, type II cytoskeletal 1-like n=1 Tax=Impatiens glandulifera TaxID=253017 RepID=UPI001FB09B01|nr:keratin, type II cytoskeletal 1-like [Impatiens glandulifera]